ncbi:MAG: putative sulfate/molybdate transporter [Pacificimonas sp.]|jgi:hypothetical protein|nr:putative sulfate/molybdate transporter [Pacificimonas sp.]
MTTETKETRQEGRMSPMGEVSGAFGDLGTFLPYVVAAIGAGLLAPTALLLGFAAGYLLVAVVYRTPVAVQPMKAIGPLMLAGALSSQDIVWAGAVIGAALLVFAAIPALGGAARAVPQSVVTGLQAGLGLVLLLVAVDYLQTSWSLAIPALACLACAYVWPRGPWAIVVIAGGTLWAPSGFGSDAVTSSVAGPADPLTVLSAIVAQLPLTLLNAVVVTAAVAHQLFPHARDTVSVRKLAATSGILNLALAPLGAMPMCHGAGGVTAHHRFGARGIGAPLLLATLCLVGAAAGPTVIAVLARIPDAVIGALLVFAALDLIASRRMVNARPDCQPVIAATAVGTLAAGAFVGLIIGLAAETLRRHIARRRSCRAAGQSHRK